MHQNLCDRKGIQNVNCTLLGATKMASARKAILDIKIMTNYNSFLSTIRNATKTQFYCQRQYIIINNTIAANVGR